ncbi:MAG: DUF2029 domain-containing protein, partial [Candidatus Dadabacteria bacterium]
MILSEKGKNFFFLTALLGLIVIFISAFFIKFPPSSAGGSGDLPGFLVASNILKKGYTEKLYDTNLQKEIENKLWPELKGTLLVFAYPPYTAFLLKPFGYLTPKTAKNIFVLLHLLFWIAALWLLKESFRIQFWKVLTISLLYPYLLLSIIGAQNSAFTSFLLALAIWSIRRNASFLAGISLGILLYKPQFGAVMFFYLLAIKDKKALAGYFLIAFIYYAIALNLLGALWPLVWLKALSSFGTLNYYFNSYQMVSLNAVFWNYLYHLGFSKEVCDKTAFFLSVLSLLYLVGYTLFYITRRKELNRQYLFITYVYFLVFLSPQTLLY